MFGEVFRGVRGTGKLTNFENWGVEGQIDKKVCDVEGKMDNVFL